MHANEYDIAIIGFGPVGHMAAALLGRYGHRILVIERQKGLYPLPRIGHLDHEIMRVLQSAGAAHEFAQKACACTSYDWINGNGDVLIHFNWDKPEATGWASHYFFYQPDMDEILARIVDDCPHIETLRGWEAKAIRQRETFVEIDIAERDTGAGKAIRARYVIGADGANSFTRTACGLAWEDLGFHADWLVVDYRPNDPDAAIDMPEAGQICDPKRPTSLFRRIGREHCRWEFMLLPGEKSEEMSDPARIWELLSPWVRPEDGRLIRNAVYTFRSGLAAEWRAGRVLLIGDAAHLMPPFLGQGMGSGFRDAINLAWKLDLVLKGAVSDAILDSYMEERKPHVAAIIEQAVALGKIVCIVDPEEAQARDDLLLKGQAAPPPPFPTLGGQLFSQANGASGLVGAMGPQADVRYGGKTGLCDDVAGAGWKILTFDGEADQLVEDGPDNLKAILGMQALRLSSDGNEPGAAEDISGFYRDFLTRFGLHSLVVRPDFYVYGVASSRHELRDLLHSLSKAVHVFEDIPTATSRNEPALLQG